MNITEKTAHVTFMKWDCIIETAQYRNERLALSLIDAQDFEFVATASVNISDEMLEADEICIKNWNENKGMLEVMVEAKVVLPAHRQTHSGYVTVPICRLNLKDFNFDGPLVEKI